MKSTKTKRSALRAGVLGAAAGLALLAACEAKVPTGPEIEAMDVASASKAVTGTRLMMKSQMDSAIYVVDGREVDAKTANSLTPNQIATIDIAKGNEARSTIRITTNGNAPDPNAAGSSRMELSVHGGARKTALRSADPASQPLILIDGVKADDARLQALNPDQIASIQVIKGAKALTISSDPAAKNGVIEVTTKK